LEELPRAAKSQRYDEVGCGVAGKLRSNEPGRCIPRRYVPRTNRATADSVKLIVIRCHRPVNTPA